MLRSILIGLDGSEDNRAAQELGLRWAKEYDAEAVGLAVADDPGVMATEAAILFDVYPDGSTPEPLPHRLRARAEEARARFAARAGEVGVRSRVVEGAGVPYARIIEESERSDVVVLGRPTHFEFGSGGGGGDQTLVKVLREGPRPVIAVPKDPAEGEAVVVAYDGSVPSARALAAFEATGLGRSRPIHVVVASTDGAEAARRAGRAVDFLRAHELDARPVSLGSAEQPAVVVLDHVGRLGAGLLVAGAYGRSSLHELFVGSTTRRLLDSARVPLFCTH